MATKKDKRDVKPLNYKPEVIQAPMRSLVARVKARGFLLSDKRALEFFAREGNWQTVAYASEVDSLDAWEIDPQFAPALRRNLPAAKIRIDDSFKLAKRREFRNVFGFVVLDNPQNVYGDKGQYCEHFEVLALVPQLINNDAIVIFNINRAPFNYHRFPEWRRRREKFYKRKRTAHLGVDFLERHYRQYFKRLGLKVVDIDFKVRHESQFLYCIVRLVRK